MSTKEITVIDQMLEEQRKAFVKLFDVYNDISEEEPDEWDKEMIERSKSDNSECVSLEQAADELGIDLDAL